MYIKIHRSYRNVVALADKEIIGKKFEEGKRQLDVRENFYKDKEVTHEEAVKILQLQSVEDATFNIVGKKSIAAAIEAGIASQESISVIKGIPFTLILV
ncbi:DUF424 family protein [Candidatus Pacearchaeota archaeon]|nr:DUF424 family protein [Candidatus Pacearchaeota archaeon]